MKIDSVTIATPSSITVELQPIDKAERTESGDMMIEAITVKRKLACVWSYLTNAELTALQTAITPRSISIEYEDPRTGTTRTGTFYTGPNSQDVLRFASGSVVGWENVKFDCIEM